MERGGLGGSYAECEGLRGEERRGREVVMEGRVGCGHVAGFLPSLSHYIYVFDESERHKEKAEREGDEGW